MYYALPKTPDSMPKTERLQRFTVLMQFHPLLQRVDVERFLNDNGGLQAVVSKVEIVEPILRRVMEAYKVSTAFKDDEPMKDMDAAGIRECLVGCDLAVHNFVECHWGQIKLVEWDFLNNAFETQCGPEDFSGDTLTAMEFAMDAIELMTGSYERLKAGGEGPDNWSYQVE